MEYIAHIRLLSWAASLGGEHYTAFITFENPLKGEEVEYKLTQAQADKLNRKDKYLTYKKGETSTRFQTREHAISESIKACRKRWSNVHLILIGGGCSRQPEEVAWCIDDKIKKKLNRLYLAVEKMYDKTNDPWSRWEDAMQKACDEWDKLIETLKKKKLHA